MRTYVLLAVLACVLAGCGSKGPPKPAKPGSAEDAIDKFNTVLKMAEGKREPPPKVIPTKGEVERRKEAQALFKLPAEKQLPKEHPFCNAKQGDWARYRLADGTTQKWTITSIKSPYSSVRVEPNWREAIEVMLDIPFDPTLSHDMAANAYRSMPHWVKTDEGDETVALAGKEYQTHWKEYKLSPLMSGCVYYLKLWSSKDVPLGVVKAAHDFNTDPNQPKDVRAKQRETIELVDCGTGAEAAAAKAALEAAKADAAARQPPKATPPPPPAKAAEAKPAGAATAAKKPEPPKAPVRPPSESKKAEAPPPPAPPKAPEKVYVLKDGRKIRARSAMLLDDTYSIKDTDGKTHTVPKSDVVEVVQERQEAAEGKPAETAAAGAEKKPDEPAARKAGVLKTYILKDGRQLKAVMVVDMGQELSIKDETGKFVTVDKKDVMAVEPAGK